MAGGNINRVIITGNLTRDPETRALPSGSSVTTLRVACNGRRQNRETQQWEDVPNYFDVTVWGAQGENCQRYLAKGRAVAVDGRLQWREFTDREGNKRQAVDIVAESVQFLGGRDDAGGGNGNGYSSSPRASDSDVPIDTGDFDRTPVAAGNDDDIPF
jgi:single-strand DNA-binding protein